MTADHMAVQGDGRLVVYRLETEDPGRALRGGRGAELLAVPADGAPHALHRLVGPVPGVRDRHLLPRTARAQAELPGPVEQVAVGVAVRVQASGSGGRDGLGAGGGGPAGPGRPRGGGGCGAAPENAKGGSGTGGPAPGKN